MNDQELKNLWQAQEPSGAPALKADEQIATMRKKMAHLHRGLNTTDFLGLAAYAAVAAVFTHYFLTNPYLITRIGALILIVGDLFAAWKTIQSRRSTRQPIADAPVMEWLKYDLAKVHQQAELSRTVLWWYLVPFLIGINAFFWGLPVQLTARIGSSVFSVLIAAVTYWLNQRVRRKQWLPLQRELETLETMLCSDEFVASPDEQSMNLPRPDLNRKKPMTKAMLLGIVLIVVGAIIFVSRKHTQNPTFDSDDPISQRLEAIRVKHKVPALAVAVVLDGRIVLTNAVGLRKNDGIEPVALGDKFHLGAITKSMTATVAARLVEEGKISWTNTIGEIFHDFQNEIHPDYRPVTLEQLLEERGGAPETPPKEIWDKAWEAAGTPTTQRLEFVKALLALKPEALPGAEHINSNQGYAMAGAMLEAKTGISWEELMRAYLFEPLQMKSGGFGAPATIGKVDQPWGHIALPELYPIPPGDPHADNPAAIGPAVIAHCSIEDLAKYAAFHLAGDRGGGKLLKPETFKKLHTALDDNDDYALGWKLLPRRWARGRALWYNGSNRMFFAVVWIAPNRNFAVVAATNAGGADAEIACDDAASEMIRKYLVQ